MTDCPSHLLMSRYKANDLEQLDAENIRCHLELCAACTKLSEEMDTNIREFSKDEDNRIRRLNSEIDQKFGQSKTRSTAFKSFALAGLFAAAAAALLFLFFGIDRTENSQDSDRIAFKGEFSMKIIGNRQGKQFEVKDGTSLKEGDSIMFIVTVGEPGYLTIFSKDKSGKLSPFYPDNSPEQDVEPLRIEAAGIHIMDGSILLDDVLGEETYTGVFSSKPFNRKDAFIPKQGKELIVRSITVMKESNPTQ